jgi:septal ring factor EnvC (AmiA/AmiB activator)
MRADRLVLGVVAAALIGAAAPAEDLVNRTRRVESALEGARAQERLLEQDREALARELAVLREEATASAALAQANEAAVREIESSLRRLEADVAARKEALVNRRERLNELLIALERLARTPREALLFRHSDALDAARAARLIGRLVPMLDGEALALRHDLEALAATQDRLAGERDRLRIAEDERAGERSRLERLIARRTEIFRATEIERTQLLARANQLGRELGTIRELIDRLAAERAAVERAAAERMSDRQRLAARGRSFVEARGRIRPPVEGSVQRSFGDVDDAGVTNRGVNLSAIADAIVVAPWQASVVFAGPFRGYGLVLILEQGGGYHWLIAGLGRLDVVPGQTVAAGEPIGLVGSKDGDDAPTVYLELRRNGQPIDPMPWLAASNGKVSG